MNHVKWTYKFRWILFASLLFTFMFVLCVICYKYQIYLGKWFKNLRTRMKLPKLLIIEWVKLLIQDNLLFYRLIFCCTKSAHGPFLQVSYRFRVIRNRFFISSNPGLFHGILMHLCFYRTWRSCCFGHTKKEVHLFPPWQPACFQRWGCWPG